MTEGTAPMRSAEFKMIRESLSLTVATMAALLAVNEGTVKNWEKGKYSPPVGVAADVVLLEDYTRAVMDAVVDIAETVDDPMVVVWRLTSDMPPGPGRALGAGWWRSVAARARERIPGLDVGYPDELDEVTGSRDRTLSEAIGLRVLALLPPLPLPREQMR